MVATCGGNDTRTCNLTTELTIGGVALRSRLWCGRAPWLALDWSDGRQQQAILAVAAGLTAALVVRAAIRADGRSAPGEPCLDRSADLQLLAQRIAEVRASGAELVVELTHGGPRCGDFAPQRPLGPAALRDQVSGRTPRAIDSAELEMLISDFAAAGRAAQAAGARLLGLEVANGSLLHAYLSPLTGGAAASQPAQLPALRVTTILAAQLPLVVALCLEDQIAGGLTPTAGIATAQALVQAGASALVVSSGHRWARHLSDQQRPPAALVEGRAARLGHWVKRTLLLPVGVVGGLRSRAGIDALLAAGALDFAVLERPFACQPDLGRQLAALDGRSACISGAACLRPVPTWRAR